MSELSFAYYLPTQHLLARLERASEQQWKALWQTVSVLYTPELLLLSDSLPDQIEEPTSPEPATLVLVPSLWAEDLSDTFPAGALMIIDGESTRAELVREIEQRIQSSRTPTEQADSSVADFWALGTNHFLLQLFSEELGEKHSWEKQRWQQNVLSAAKAHQESKSSEVQDCLKEAFCYLYQCRTALLDISISLFDLVLFPNGAEAEASFSFVPEQPLSTPMNLILTADELQGWLKKNPAQRSRLQEALQCGQLELIGGERNSTCRTLAPLAILREEFEQGHALFQEICGEAPLVWGRRSFGFSAQLPGLLRQFGYVGALHLPFDNGVCPFDDSPLVHWQGAGGATIPAVTQRPLNSLREGNASAFLITLANKTGESEHSCFLVREGETENEQAGALWWQDLSRASHYAPVWGEFKRLREHFPDTNQSEKTGPLLRTGPGDYQTAERQQIQADSKGIVRLKEFVCQYRQWQDQVLDEWLLFLWSILQQQMPTGSLTRQELLNQIGPLLVGSSTKPNQESKPRSVWLNSQPLATAALLTDSAAVGPLVPGCGFAFREEPTTDDLLADEELWLDNQQVFVALHPQTGGIEQFRASRSRQNLISQMLAFRFAKPVLDSQTGQMTHYTRMQIEQSQVRVNQQRAGYLQSSGKLVHPTTGTPLATFRQRVLLPTDSHFIRADIELISLQTSTETVIPGYFVQRIAWPDRPTRLTGSAHHHPFLVRTERIESPDFLELANDQASIVYATGGLPFHERTGTHLLDTFLPVSFVCSDQPFEFSFHFGLNEEYPLSFCWQQERSLLLQSVSQWPDQQGPGQQASGWFFDFGAKNVTYTHVCPTQIRYDSPNKPAETVWAIDLLETEGRQANLLLRCCRPIQQAWELDAQGQIRQEFSVKEGAVSLSLTALEWKRIGLCWGW